jgi:hypothetical protein
MLVSDVRTGVQVAAAEGRARKKDFALGAIVAGLSGVGGLGGYTNTNEGKVIAASFLDNYNAIVVAVRDSPDFATYAAGGGTPPKAGAVYEEGDVVVPKIDNVKLLAEPSDAARALATLTRAQELVYLGEEKDGYVKVQAATGEGWVKRVLVTKR